MAPPIQPPMKLIQLKDDCGWTWEAPLDKIQWSSRTGDSDRQDVLAIADHDAKYLRQHGLPEDDYLLLHTTEAECSDIMSALCGNVLGRVTLSDLIPPF